MTTGADPTRTRPAFPRATAALLLAASAAVCLWYLPYGLPTPDAGAALLHAQRIADGAVFYRDLDAYPFPLASYLLAAVLKVFGDSLEVARAFAAVVFTLIVLASHRLAFELGGRRAGVLCALAVLSLRFLAWPAFQDALYPEVALALALWSMVSWFGFARAGRLRDLAVAGVLAGLTVLAKQNLGIYLGLASGGLLLVGAAGSATVRGRFREIAAWGLAAAAPIVVACAYFLAHGVLGQMLYSGLVRPFTGYAPTSGVPFLVPLRWWQFGELQGPSAFAYSVGPLFEMLGMGKLPAAQWYPWIWAAEEAWVRLLYTALPLVFAAAALAMVLCRSSRRELACLAALGLACVASAFPRADYYHIASIAPALFVLAFVTGARLVGAMRSDRWRTIAATLATAATASVFAATIGLGALYFRDMTYEAGNERGRMRIYPENAWVDDVLQYVDARTAGGEGLFVYGHEAYYYFFSGTRAPWPFVQLYPGMAGDDDGRALAAELAAAPPAVVVQGLLAGWPGLPDAREYTGEVRTFLESRYRATARPFADGFGPDAQAPPAWLLQVMEPVATADD